MHSGHRNGPGVGLLAGGVTGLYKKPIEEWRVCTVWACDCCGDAINTGTRCLPCEIYVYWNTVCTITVRGKRYYSVRRSDGTYFVVPVPSSRKRTS